MSNPINKDSRLGSVFTAEMIDAQGRSEREYLTTRVKLLLDVKEKHPSASFADIAQLANETACGRGCCCCCDTLVLGADIVNPVR